VNTGASSTRSAAGSIVSSIGVASTARRKFAHWGEAVSTATEMKSFAKRDPRSSYAVDRRTADNATG